jgi:hypothetical protein
MTGSDYGQLRRMEVGFLFREKLGQDNSRFPEGMTDRKATTRAKTTATADSPEGNDRQKSKEKSKRRADCQR